MTAKAAAGFTLRTHKGIERGGGLLPALGAALLLAGIAGQVCSAMGMPVDCWRAWRRRYVPPR